MTIPDNRPDTVSRELHVKTIVGDTSLKFQFDTRVIDGGEKGFFGFDYIGDSNNFPTFVSPAYRTDLPNRAPARLSVREQYRDSTITGDEHAAGPCFQILAHGQGDYCSAEITTLRTSTRYRFYIQLRVIGRDTYAVAALEATTGMPQRHAAPPVPTAIETDQGVRWTWDANTDPTAPDNYLIHIVGNDGEILQEHLLNIDTTELLVTNLPLGTRYTFRNVARGNLASSDPTEEQVPLPTPVLSLTNIELDEVTLNWEEVDNAEDYQTFYYPVGDADNLVKGNTQGEAERSSSIDGLNPNTEYVVGVVAKAPDFSPSRAMTTVTTLALGTLDPPVAEVSVNPQMPSNAILSWGSVTNATRYVVTWQATGDADTSMRAEITAAPGPTQTYTIEGLDAGTVYTITLTAQTAGYIDGGPTSVQWPAIASISAGSTHTCVVDNGMARCWGGNDSGQLGNDSTIDSSLPVQVEGLTSGVTAVAAGVSHSCAIHNGAAKCWGLNSNGQLGNGIQLDGYSSTPVQVVGLTSGVTAISAGSEHSCAIHNGAAKCWGSNDNGRLGSGANDDSLVPIQVQGLNSSVTAISAGVFHSCAVHNGAAKCWGDNGGDFNRLGDETEMNSNVPVQVAAMAGLAFESGVTAISANRDHSCALRDGKIRCWGQNDFNRLGISSNGAENALIDLSGVTAIATGRDHNCAVLNEETRCWGSNQFRQLAQETLPNETTTSNTLRTVSGLHSGITAISAGEFHTCAIHFGVAKCWGQNDRNQLGSGASGSPTSSTPVLVTDLTEPQLSAPSGLGLMRSATATTISWNRAPAGFSAVYLISYTPGGENPVEVVVSAGTYRLAGLTENTAYTLNIVAQAEGYRNSNTFTTTFTTLRTLAAIAIGVTGISANDATITWDDIDDATAYEVSITEAGEMEALDTKTFGPGVESSDASVLEGGTRYVARVVARAEGFEESRRSTNFVTQLATPKITAGSRTTQTVVLTWTEVANNAEMYQLRLRLAGETNILRTVSVAASDMRYPFDSLEIDTGYEVLAIAQGEGFTTSETARIVFTTLPRALRLRLRVFLEGPLQ